MCRLLGEAMKQQETSIFMGFLSLIAFSMGHVSINVKAFWVEPVIAWVVVVMPTGKKNNLFLKLNEYCYYASTESVPKCA